MKINILKVIILFLVSVLPASGAENIEEIPPHVVDNVISEIIQPALKQYDAGALNMVQSMKRLCSHANLNELTKARSDYRNFLVAWSRVEMLRVGPFLTDNRFERSLFWPDRRGHGLRQVQKILIQKNTTVLELNWLQQKSVAMQGLLALEYVLFGRGFDVLSLQKKSHRCVYGLTIAKNLLDIEQLVRNDWDAYGVNWLSPSETNKLFKNKNEQFSAYLKLLSSNVEIVLHTKILPIFGGKSGRLKPKLAIFWRSKNTILNVQNNLIFVRSLLNVDAFSKGLTREQRLIINGVEFEFDNAIRALDSLQMPIEDILNDPVLVSRLRYVVIVLSGLQDRLRVDVPALFGLVSGFSSLDGD